MEVQPPKDLFERLVRAAPGIYIDESTPQKVYLHLVEILKHRGHEPEDALIGSTATSLIDMYNNQGITAVIINDG